MASEIESQARRAFPYRTGWHAVGCAVLFFGLLGLIAVTLIPAGYEKAQKGQLPTGIALMIMGVFGIPTLYMSFRSLYAGLRDTARPPLLQVTATAILLPKEARGEPPQDEHGEQLSPEPLHPEAIPFTAIRGVTRDGPAHNQVLEISHDLSAVPLRLHQHMMRTADFDALDQLLTLRCASRLRDEGK